MKRKNLIKVTILGLGIVSVVLSAKTYAETSTFMYYKTVDEIGTITICDPNDGSKCITMQDKNLGASVAGTGTSSYGYHYQWGNNYGFKSCNTNGCTDFPLGEQYLTTRVDTSIYGPGNRYNSNIFRQITTDPYDRSISENRNLWGGTGDDESSNFGYPMNNSIERKGPCETGYHVPSIGEWSKLLEYWISNSNLQGYDLIMETTDQGLNYLLTGLNDDSVVIAASERFRNDFYIPFDGVRDYYDNSVLGLGWASNLATSSACKDFGRRCVYTFSIYSASISSKSWNDTAGAVPVRCFRNSALTFPGDSKIIVNIASLNSGQNTCSGEDYIFPNISALPTVQTISLAKRFSCVFGNAAAKAVTLQLSGDLKDGNGNVISGENVKLSNPDWTATPAVLKNGTTTFSGQTFLGTGKTLFNKVANKIGQAYGSGVEIKITIPAGTPDGLYEGTLVLTY